MTNGNSKRFLKITQDECARFVGDRLVPPPIADALGRSAKAGGVLFADHPAALATLVLAAYEATGGKNSSDVAPAAAAMEFLLAAGDVLDDLQDRDLEDNPIADHAECIEQTELLTALLLLAEHAILSVYTKNVSDRRVLSAARIFTRFKIKAFDGQYLDAHAKDSTATTPRQVLERTRHKSGSLGICAGMIGATLATDDQESINLAGDFGKHLGVVYQLKNDLSDIWPEYGSFSDLASGKATAPTAFALAVGGGESGSTAIARMLENHLSARSEIEQARKETFDSGGVHFTMIQSFANLAKASSIANELAEKHPGSNVLSAMGEF